jgi:NADH:ubiquinone oxidoreductase subunit 4 (subunit M)
VGDADNLEKFYIFTLVVVIMLVGIYPRILTDVINVWVTGMPLP